MFKSQLYFASCHIFFVLMLIFRFEKESGKIDYHAFLSEINWRENASIPLPPDAALKVS